MYKIVWITNQNELWHIHFPSWKSWNMKKLNGCAGSCGARGKARHPRESGLARGHWVVAKRYLWTTSERCKAQIHCRYRSANICHFACVVCWIRAMEFAIWYLEHFGTMMNHVFTQSIQHVTSFVLGTLYCLQFQHETHDEKVMEKSLALRLGTSTALSFHASQAEGLANLHRCGASAARCCFSLVRKWS